MLGSTRGAGTPAWYPGVSIRRKEECPIGASETDHACAARAYRRRPHWPHICPMQCRAYATSTEVSNAGWRPVTEFPVCRAEQPCGVPTGTDRCRVCRSQSLIWLHSHCRRGEVCGQGRGAGPRVHTGPAPSFHCTARALSRARRCCSSASGAVLRPCHAPKNSTGCRAVCACSHQAHGQGRAWARACSGAPQVLGWRGTGRADGQERRIGQGSALL